MMMKQFPRVKKNLVYYVKNKTFLADALPINDKETMVGLN